MNFNRKQIVTLPQPAGANQIHRFELSLGASYGQRGRILIGRDTYSPGLKAIQIDDASVIHEIAREQAQPVGCPEELKGRSEVIAGYRGRDGQGRKDWSVNCVYLWRIRFQAEQAGTGRPS